MYNDTDMAKIPTVYPTEVVLFEKHQILNKHVAGVCVEKSIR